MISHKLVSSNVSSSFQNNTSQEDDLHEWQTRETLKYNPLTVKCLKILRKRLLSNSAHEYEQGSFVLAIVVTKG